MSAREVLERKRALLESIDAEETARKALVKVVRELATTGGGEPTDKVEAEARKSVAAILGDLLRKKRGAQHYEEQLYSDCQNALDAMDKEKKTNEDKSAPSSSPSGPESPEPASPQDSSNGKRPETGNAMKRLNPMTLGLLNFEQLVKHLKEAEEADHEANLLLLLQRLERHTKLSKEKVSETGAGKIISKLSKHRLREIKEKAAVTMAAWKKILVQQQSIAEKAGKEKQKEKVKDAPVSKKSDKDGKRTIKIIDEGNASPKKAKKHDKEKGKEKDKDPKRKKSSKRDDENSSEDGSEDDFEAYRRKRQKELSDQYERVEKEEAYSAWVGENEDDMALLEELRAAKKQKQKQKERESGGRD